MNRLRSGGEVLGTFNFFEELEVDFAQGEMGVLAAQPPALEPHQEFASIEHGLQALPQRELEAVAQEFDINGAELGWLGEGCVAHGCHYNV